MILERKHPSIDRRMDKEDVVWPYTHAHSRILAIKRNGTRPFAATWMYLEIIIPSEVTQRKTNIR